MGLPMRFTSLFRLLILSLGRFWPKYIFLLSSFLFSVFAAAESRPNILLVVADDLGFADVGFMGSEIRTPNLDSLAEEGIIFTDFHTAFTCSPTRAMLLTGVDSHLAGLGNMAEELAPNQRGKPGYEGYLNQRVTSIARELKDSGYRTYMTGKWHLGMAKDQGPSARGFERSFAMLSGGASHYGDMRPAYGTKEGGIAPYRQDGKKLEQLPKSFRYSSEFYADQLLDYLKTDEKNQQRSEKPFFAYLSFTAPHWPLQAPKQAIEQYRGVYDIGYEALQEQRLARQQQLGLIDELAAMPPGTARWSEMTASEKRQSARSMEVYAAMVSEMDRHLGRVVQHLEQQGQLDNTVIVFLSDNGAEGHDLEATWPQAVFPKVNSWIRNNHDFSYPAMGLPGSYVLYGPGWAQAGAPGFYGYKGFASEGGSHVPAFVYYPKALKPRRIDDLVRVIDLAPTLLQFAGVSSAPRKNKLAMTGRSILPSLQGQSQEPVSFISELFAKRVVRHGEWKAVHMPPPIGSGQWQLYHIATDRAERKDLAGEKPKVLAQMRGLWQNYQKRNGVILPDFVSGY